MLKIKSWTALQDRIWEKLQKLQAQEPAYAHRFYDTHSAGNYLPNQPADFLLLYRGKAIFLEVKFSEKHTTLRSCFASHVKKNQVASAELAIRAGASYYFPFYSSVSRLFELWEGGYCRQQSNLGKPLNSSLCSLRTDDLEKLINWITQ